MSEQDTSYNFKPTKLQFSDVPQRSATDIEFNEKSSVRNINYNNNEIQMNGNKMNQYLMNNQIPPSTNSSTKNFNYQGEIFGASNSKMNEMNQNLMMNQNINPNMMMNYNMFNGMLKMFMQNMQNPSNPFVNMNMGMGMPFPNNNPNMNLNLQPDQTPIKQVENPNLNELFINKTKNLNEFYNTMSNNSLKVDDPYLKSANSRKKHDESEIKLPNKSEFLNFQTFHEDNNDFFNENDISKISENPNYLKKTKQNESTYFEENSRIKNQNLNESNLNYNKNYEEMAIPNKTYKKEFEIEESVLPPPPRNAKPFKKKGNEADEMAQKYNIQKKDEDYLDNNISNRNIDNDISHRNLNENNLHELAEKNQGYEADEIDQDNFFQKNKLEKINTNKVNIKSQERKFNKKPDDFPENDEESVTPVLSKQNSQPLPRNLFDEKPITVKATNFEELLEEQLAQDAQENNNNEFINEEKRNKKKTTFLKKGTRQFLSSAGIKNEKKERSRNEEEKNRSSEERILPLKKEYQQKSNPNLDPFSKETKNLKSKTSDDFYRSKTVDSENSLNKIEENLPNNLTKDEKAKNFLVRGKGKGGGKGILSKEEDLKAKELEKTEELVDEDRFQSSGKKYEPNKYAHSRTSSAHTPSYEKIQFSDDKEWVENKNIKTSFSKNPNKEKEREVKKLNFTPEKENEEQMSENSDAPPQSNLLNKYFKGNEKNEKLKKNSADQKKIDLTKEQEEEIVKKYVAEKIDTLNEEIAKFKQENENLKRSKRKNEDLQKSLNKQIEEFNKRKEQEMEEFENLKQEELKKLQKERKIADRQNKAMANVPNRKEREEIENLKKQVASLTDQIKLKDQRNKLAYERIKKSNEELLQKNQELQQEIQLLEATRLNSNKNEEKKSIKIPKKEEKIEEKQIKRPSIKSENMEEENLENYEDIVMATNDNVFDTKYSSKVAEKKSISIIPTKEKDSKHPKNNSNHNAKDLSIKKENKEKNPLKSKANEIKKPELADEFEEIKNEDSKDNKDPDPYNKITIRNLNKYFDESDFHYENNEFYQRYIIHKQGQHKIKTHNVTEEGKITRIYEDGRKELVFPHGVRREVFQDNYTIVHFSNNDIKQCLPNNVIIYYFSEAQTTQTTLPNGPNIYKFANNQIEIHHADGSKEIKFSDGTEKYIYSNGEEETIFGDGTISQTDLNKTKTIFYTNGEKEIVYSNGSKVKQYPDGRTKKF